MNVMILEALEKNTAANTLLRGMLGEDAPPTPETEDLVRLRNHCDRLDLIIRIVLRHREEHGFPPNRSFAWSEEEAGAARDDSRTLMLGCHDVFLEGVAARSPGNPATPDSKDH